MLEFTGFLGLTRISFFCSHRSHSIALWVGNLTDGSACGLARTDSTLLLGSHGSHRSHGIALWVGNLTDASACGLARTDSILLLGSHGSHRSHGVALWVGNLTDGSVGVGSLGLHGARSHGLIFWTLRTNQTYRTNRTDWTFLKIIREICGICVRPPWDWDLCEASVDSVWAGDKITKNCVIWGAF